MSKATASAAVEERRNNLAGTARALRARLSPDRLVGDGIARAQELAGGLSRSLMDLMRRNPGAVAVTCAGLAWLAIGSRSREPAVDPHFDAVTRWEGEGGNPHPEFDTPAAEVDPKATAARAAVLPDGWFWQAAGRVAGDHPLPLGLFAAALGGVIAARLPATEIEKAALSGAKEHLFDEAKRFLDDERAQIGEVASNLGQGLQDDLQSAKDRVAGAVDRIVHPRG